VRQDDGKPSSRRRRQDSSADNFFDGVSRVGMNFVLPAITSKIKDVFGVDLSQQLLGLTSGEAHRRETPARRKGAKKGGTKRASRKGASKRRVAKKSGAK
jgi:hypothetical protein